MPSKIVNDLIEKVKELDKAIVKIAVQLAINTWLTGLILAGLLAQAWYVVFHR